MKWRVFSVSCFLFFAFSTASAQDVVVSYADSGGSIIKYRIADGAQVARVQQVYRAGINLNTPTTIAVVDGSYYYVVLGSRYLARLRASDGTILWVVDAGITVGITTYFVTDMAVAGDNIFVSTLDPRGRISKYRAADGALLWSVQSAILEGSVCYLPLKLAAVGNDSFLVVLGSKYLVKMRQSNSAVLWQANISLTTGITTWGVGDLTVRGAVAYLSNLDPNGTVRKVDVSANPVMIWSVTRTYQIGVIKYLPTKLAAVGPDDVMILFGNRYLARMKATNGQILWTKDVGLPIGYLTVLATDAAAIAAP